MKRPNVVSLAILCVFAAAPVVAQQPKQIPPEQFEQLHAMFKTQPDESRFWELPWKIQLDEAISQGAEQGKPIFVWCGAGGAPVGVC